MPGVYREKVCPNCSVTHRKRGEFCGQACASSYRGQTEETKKKLSMIKREYDLTPEGIAHNKMLSRIMTNPEEPRVTIEDFAVDIPTIRDIRDYDLDGYDRAEDW
jgi:hypothetical protein